MGHGKVRLDEHVWALSKHYLNYHSKPSNFEAGSFVGKRQKNRKQPPIILNVVFFGEKAEIYDQKFRLAGKVISVQRKKYLSESVSLHQRHLKEKAEVKEKAETTHNCEAKVFTDTDVKITSKAVTIRRAIGDINTFAVNLQPNKESLTHRAPQ